VGKNSYNVGILRRTGIVHMPESETFIRPPGLCYNLIPPPVDFTGRKVELATLLANFERGVLITSPADELGNGMTALARRLAVELRKDFPDGCLEIDLRGGLANFIEPLSPAEAQRRLLLPFYPDTSLPDDEKTLEELYRETFAARKVLLLLDNAAGPAQLRRLVPRQPSAVIVTARTEFPTLAKLYPLSLGGLPAEDARALLIRIAPACATLPRRLMNKILENFGSSLLALRIVGALLRDVFAKNPRALLSRYNTIHRRLMALRPTGINLPVAIALELAYETLPVEQRTFFEALAVFPAPFSRAAAAMIWGLDPAAADALLVAFVRRNLVMYYPEADLYALHDLVAVYIQELLLGQPEWTRQVMGRYVRYTLIEAGRANALYRAGGVHREEGVARFLAVWPHVWAAWLRMSSADPGWPRPDDVDRWLCEFAGRVLPILQTLVPLAERTVMLERILQAARALDRATEALVLNYLGQAYTAQGDAKRALEVYEAYLQIAYDLHDRTGEATALMHIGTVCGALGDIKRARESWRHALALFKMIGDPRAAQLRLWLEALERNLTQSMLSIR